MRKLLAGLAVTALLAIASPASAAGSDQFTSSSESASKVEATFTVEHNRFYTLQMFDSADVQVCQNSVQGTVNGLEDGSSYTLMCQVGTVAAYSAVLTVEHSARFTPTFTWS
jgi:ABC-type oligopeptide transport system substrate-binding subunit